MTFGGFLSLMENNFTWKVFQVPTNSCHAPNMWFCASGADGKNISICVSRPEIGCLKNNQKWN